MSVECFNLNGRPEQKRDEKNTYLCQIIYVVWYDDDDEEQINHEMEKRARDGNGEWPRVRIEKKETVLRCVNHYIYGVKLGL